MVKLGIGDEDLNRRCFVLFYAIFEPRSRWGNLLASSFLSSPPLHQINDRASSPLIRTRTRRGEEDRNAEEPPREIGGEEAARRHIQRPQPPPVAQEGQPQGRERRRLRSPPPRAIRPLRSHRPGMLIGNPRRASSTQTNKKL